MIFKVPSHLRNKNLTAYEPKVVSIGPYHHGKPQFEFMEKQKRRALDNFAKRSGVTIQAYTDEMRKVVGKLKSSYADLDLVRWNDDDEFIKLMILDGCFFIEFLSGRARAFNRHYPDNDPVFGPRGHAINDIAVRQDLLMVENQLPYLAVQTLWLTVPEGRQKPDVGAISQWVASDIMEKDAGFHMLDTHMEELLQIDKRSIHDKEPGKLCASELYQFNVYFRKAESYNKLHFNITTGVLTLPIITINERTVSTYLNMVARASTRESSTAAIFIIYTRLMGTLVQSTKDVRLLQSHGIIINQLSNREAVLEVIQDIAKGTISSDVIVRSNDLSYISIIEGLDKFCKLRTIRLRKTLYVWFTNLTETHFKTPWSGLSLIAAITLLALTVIQTVYAILSLSRQH
ncbi:hypothetical protein MKW94_013644 [Papaver nudicaule]|uniref:Uncharacterized protein n=1 Tax=Papaver nudicaule TaxID=74823 RepID=A0AA41VLV3_PAPNU|nr:hypothetical protein [Papaver nudicaule]